MCLSFGVILVALFLCISCGFVSSTNAPTTARVRPRILGAEEISHSKYLFVVALMKKDEAEAKEYQYCTGSVITAKQVLTACHCVGDVVGDDVRMFDARLIRVIGATGKILEDDPERQVLRARTLVPHAKCQFYEPGTIIDNDVGLIKLKGSFDFGEDIKPMSMSEGDPDALRLRLKSEIRLKRVCHIPGFGYSEPDTPSSGLREAEVRLVSEYDCRKKFCEKRPKSEYCNHDFYMKGQFCAMATDTKDGAAPCKGDSGAPIICDGYVYGVLSWGGCRPEYPIVLARGNLALELIKMHSKVNYGEARRAAAQPRRSASSHPKPLHYSKLLLTATLMLSAMKL